MAWCDSYVENKHRAKIWQSYTHARAAVSAERLVASPLIKRKPSPQLTLHGRPSSVVNLWAVAWSPGLPSRPTRRSVWLQIVCWTGRVFSPPPPSSGGIIKERTTLYVASSMRFLLVFSCNWWNCKRFNSLTLIATYTTRRYTRIFVRRGRRLYTFCTENGHPVCSTRVLVVL